jgi:hypothetical protein
MKRDLAFLQRVSALVYPVYTTIFLTTTDWAGIAKEVAATPGLKTSKNRAPTRTNFKHLIIGRLTAVNSGTDDQDVCNMLNAPEERKSQFREKHDRLAIRAGTKPSEDYEDEATNNPFPDALRREVQAKLRFKYGNDIEVVP